MPLSPTTTPAVRSASARRRVLRRVPRMAERGPISPGRRCAWISRPRPSEADSCGLWPCPPLAGLCEFYSCPPSSDWRCSHALMIRQIACAPDFAGSSRTTFRHAKSCSRANCARTSIFVGTQATAQAVREPPTRGVTKQERARARGFRRRSAGFVLSRAFRPEAARIRRSELQLG